MQLLPVFVSNVNLGFLLMKNIENGEQINVQDI
jgi:hypothetical protein